MPYIREGSLPVVGHFDIEVYGSGRHGRQIASRFALRCDAIGHHDNEILLLSVVGAETSVRALVAGLRSSGRDQHRIEYSAHVGNINCAGLSRFDGGYRIVRTKLDYGLWHVLCLAKRGGFMPVMTDEAVWQHLLGSEFTTPLLREWTPWLYQQMKDRQIIVELTQSGCQAGLLLADNNSLDSLVSEGLLHGHLAIDGGCSKEPAIENGIQNLDQYMLTFGSMLGKQAERSLNPLHVPGRDSLPRIELLREPFEAQSHVIEAVRKALCRQKSLMLVGEMGTGKTIMGMAAIHAHSHERPYRALVFCPGQLIHKWEREIRETIPGAEVIQLESWKSLLHLDRAKRPGRAQWYVIARDRAKLGPKWRPAYIQLRHTDQGFIRCPGCGLRLVDEERESVIVGKPAKTGQAGTGLWKRRSKCAWVLTNERGKDDPDKEHGGRLIEGCGSPLWQMTSEIQRYEPALFIKRHLRRFFDYLILDEVHEEKGADTAQGHAAGALAACCGKVIALTGTLVGGYSEHLRPLLFRLAPRSLVQEGLGWSNSTAFNECYGRVETRITERSSGSGEDNRTSRGSKTTTKSVRPGIMPILFGRHLIDKAVFLSLNEVADNLPPLEEECIHVSMDEELARAYRQDVEKPLADAIKEMLRRKDRRLLGTMLQTLLAYPDHPYGWEPVGYFKAGEFVKVAEPPVLSEDVVRPKEQILIDLVRGEKEKGRKVWVYVQFTDKHDVQCRLENLFTRAGFQVAVLHSSVPLAQREEWIAEHAPKLDVVISHPRLVETGLDLFDKNGRHNFPTICHYETGYNLFTLRQASRRSWRIGQKEPCRIVYFYYKGTMQDRAMVLMGKKLAAARSLEGSFSSEGLVALAGEDASVELALARSLAERMDEGDARRMWSKVFNPRKQADDIPICSEPQLLFELTAQASVTPPFSKSRPRRRTRTMCGVGGGARKLLF